MGKKVTYTERQIRRMSYQERLRHYEEEKDELFYQIASMPAADVQRAHDDLIRKWMI